MHCQVKEVRIARKFAFEKAQEVQRSVGLANRHRAAHARETCIAFQRRVRIMLCRSLQSRKRLLAMAGLGQAHRLLAGSRHIRRFFGSLGG